MNRRVIIQTLLSNAITLPFLTQCSTMQSGGTGKFGIKSRFGGMWGLYAKSPAGEDALTPYAEDVLASMTANKASVVCATYTGSVTLARATERDRFGPGFGGTLDPNDRKAGSLRIELTCRKTNILGGDTISIKHQVSVNGQVTNAMGGLAVYLAEGDHPAHFTEKLMVSHMIGPDGVYSPLSSGKWRIGEESASLGPEGSAFVPAIGRNVAAWRWSWKRTGRNATGQRMETRHETIMSSDVPCRVISQNYSLAYNGRVTSDYSFALTKVQYA
jgi:hypothetical protein